VNNPPTDRPRALHFLEAADFVRDAHFRDGLSVQEIGAALRHTADAADPMVGSLARDGFGLDEIAAMLAEPAVPAGLVAVPPTSTDRPGCSDPIECSHEAALGQARETNRRLNYEKQRLESELGTYRRAVRQWHVSERGTYISLGSLRAIGKAAGVDILGSRRGLKHFDRVEQAEAAIERVRALHQPDANGECQHCHHSSPCPTVQALGAADAVLAVLPAGSEDTTTTRAERDSLGREADRLRKDWVAMRTRAEQAEAERDSYGEQLDEAAETIAARTVEVNRLTEELRRLAAETQPAHSCGNCEGVDPDSCLTNLDRPAVKAQQAVKQTPDTEDEWCKCRSCWGWFVEEHPGEDLDELGRDLGWWSGLPVHRDAPAASAGVQTDEKPVPCSAVALRVHHAPHGWEPQPGMDQVRCGGYPVASHG